MSSRSQISATISAATKERLDRFTKSHGLKKNFVVEQALLYFMEARRELPDEALLPARLVLDDEAFGRIVELVDDPPGPTAALRGLAPTGSTCNGGQCCLSGSACGGRGRCACASGCTDLDTDEDNCGGCGVACRPGFRCTSGSCALP